MVTGTEEKLVAAFEKNGREQVRIYLTEFQGRGMIDLRVWAENSSGEWVRTRKGITMSVDHYDALLASVTELGAHV